MRNALRKYTGNFTGILSPASVLRLSQALTTAFRAVKPIEVTPNGTTTNNAQNTPTTTPVQVTGESIIDEDDEDPNNIIPVMTDTLLQFKSRNITEVSLQKFYKLLLQQFDVQVDYETINKLLVSIPFVKKVENGIIMLNSDDEGINNTRAVSDKERDKETNNLKKLADKKSRELA